MPEPTYDEISAEYKRLGYSYPAETDFDPEEIQEAVNCLGSEYLTKDVAKLEGDVHTTAVLNAFTNLANTLGSPIRIQYNSLVISRETTAAERRESALSTLKYSLNAAHREVARGSLLTSQEYVS